jgi:hypothetical protein
MERTPGPSTTRLGYAVVGLVVALAAGCTGGASVTPAGGDSGQSSGAPASAAASGAASAGSGGGGGSIGDPCALLTAAEIGDALSVPMKDGVVTHTGPDSSDCSWDAEDLSQGAALNLTLERFDQDLWDSFKQMGPPEDPTVDIPGIGDATIRIGGVILGGTYVVKTGDRDASFLIVAINLDDAARDAASQALAKLIAERM